VKLLPLDIRRYSPRLIESQRLGNSGIARISVAVGIGESVSSEQIGERVYFAFSRRRE
jgi:hypothetical protein